MLCESGVRAALPWQFAFSHVGSYPPGVKHLFSVVLGAWLWPTLAQWRKKSLLSQARFSYAVGLVPTVSPVSLFHLSIPEPRRFTN